MSAPELLTPTQLAELLGRRDTRTVRLDLDRLAVPTIPLGNTYRVRRVDFNRCLSAAAQRRATTGTKRRPAGVTLAPGARLWDGRTSLRQGR